METPSWLVQTQENDVPRADGKAPAAGPARPTPKANTLDAESEVDADVCAGWDIGGCEVIRRLSPGSPDTLLALRASPSGSPSLVVLERAHGGVEPMLRRADQAAAVLHPNVARVHGCEVVDDEVFWVTDFVAGATLLEIAAACRKKGMSVPLGMVVPAMLEVARGLEALAGVPARGLVQSKDVFVTFRGAARVLVHAALGGAPVAATRGLNTPLNPDVFALGALLYECLCDEPFPGADAPPPSSINIQVTPELERVAMQAVDPAGPFHSPAAFASALKDAGGQFIWKEAQRVDWMAGLFETRWRRVQVLIAGQPEEGIAEVDTRPKVAHGLPTRLMRLLAAPRATRPAPSAPPPLPPPLPRRNRAVTALEKLWSTPTKEIPLLRRIRSQPPPPLPQGRPSARRRVRARHPWRGFWLAAGATAAFLGSGLKPDELERAAAWVSRAEVTARDWVLGK